MDGIVGCRGAIWILFPPPLLLPIASSPPPAINSPTLHPPPSNPPTFLHCPLNLPFIYLLCHCAGSPQGLFRDTTYIDKLLLSTLQFDGFFFSFFPIRHGLGDRIYWHWQSSMTRGQGGSLDDIGFCFAFCIRNQLKVCWRMTVIHWLMIHEMEKLASQQIWAQPFTTKSTWKSPSIIVPNFGMFEWIFVKKNQGYGCIIEWCNCISAISEKQSILKTPQYCQWCLCCILLLYSSRYELVIHIKMCFIKICVVLSEISGKVEDIQTAIFLLIPLAIFHAGRPENIFSNNEGYINIFTNFLYTCPHWKVWKQSSASFTFHKLWSNL